MDSIARGVDKDSKLNLAQKAVWAFKLAEGYKYALKIAKSSKTSIVTLLNRSAPGKTNANWIARFDKPHKGVNYAHLNLRHKYTGIPDPHLKLPPGSLTAAKYTGYGAKCLDILASFSYLFDAYHLVTALDKDLKQGIANNTIECVANTSSLRLGGYLGAVSMGVVGGFIFPVVGSISGAVIGAVGGAYYLHGLKNKYLKPYVEEKNIPLPGMFTRLASKVPKCF